MFKNVFASIVLVVVLCLINCPPAPAQNQQPAPNAPKPEKTAAKVILSDTPIKLRIMQTVSSGTAKVGDTVNFEVVQDIAVDDTAVVKQGAVAFGTVTVAHPKRSFGRAGQLSINIDFVRLANSDKLALRAVKAGNGGNHTASMTAAAVAAGIVFFPAAPLFFFIRGKNMVVPQGTEITAFVAANTELSPALFIRPAITVLSANPSAAATELATVVFTSDPDSAEITLDGKFSGTTGSTLKLTPGEHQITIEKKGFQPWTRTISISPGSSVTVNAALIKAGI
jgi:hypothetical protein